MSKSFFTPGPRYTGAPMTRPQQLQRQMQEDRKNSKKLDQRGYTSRGFKAKKK